MLLAQQRLPPAGLLAVTLLGGALVAGSANTLNCYIDRDIDALMRRTSRRRSPTTRMLAEGPDRRRETREVDVVAASFGAARQRLRGTGRRLAL